MVAIWFVAAPGGAWPALGPMLGWVATAPLFLASYNASPWRAAGYAGAVGFICWLSTFGPGSVEAAERLGASPLSAWLLNMGCCAYQAAPFAVAGWLCGWWRAQAGWHRALVFAALWTIVLCFYPDLLPGNVAHALYRSPRLIQLLDLGGLPLLTFVVLLVSALLAEGVATLARSPRRAAQLFLAAACVPLLVLAYGSWRLAVIAEAPATELRIGFVQPAEPLDDYGSRQPISRGERDAEFDQLLALTERLATARPYLDLVLWPEVPFSLAPGGEDDARITRILGLARSRKVPILFVGSGRIGEGSDAQTTSRLFTATAAGDFGPSYDKMILVPFTEFLPFDGIVPGLKDIFTLTRQYRAGEDAAPLAVIDKAKLIAAICYESIFSGHIRAAVARGGDVIVNPVDDGWFGRSRVGSYHVALALFQSVSFRTPLAFVSNEGPSMLVDATGTPIATTLFDGVAATAATLRVPQARSVYAAAGDVFLWGLTLLMVASGVRLCSRRRQRT
jgi:apolipoprotein N-acyltransferase